jgi:hypothetical protein
VGNLSKRLERVLEETIDEDSKLSGQGSQRKMVVKSMIVPCYVIHLGPDFDNRKSLQRIGLNPIGFKGVNGKKDEYLRYREYIDPDCFDSCPKAVLGCGLSHILLAKKLYDEGADIALVLEDDAYPTSARIDFESVLASVPGDWEIIKLHTCVFGLSTAAYLINRKGMNKLGHLKVKYHIDYQISHLSDIRVYSSANLFWTDETTSNIRVSNGNVFVPSVLMYPINRIPGTSIELTIGHTVLVIILLLLLYGTVRSYSTRG